MLELQVYRALIMKLKGTNKMDLYARNLNGVSSRGPGADGTAEEGH